MDAKQNPQTFMDAAERRTQRLQPVLAHINAHLGESLPLHQLAALSGLSLWRFATVFREHMGVAPRRYIFLERVRYAKALLRAGMAPATVASEAGFCDQSHLSRRFKHACRETPGQYQSRHHHFSGHAGMAA
ncbi:helix-turn-helix domain-containing protein [Polaromonas sp. JS666]|uniref:helix-turn-helix domain-containing protein n=1 Tax=Polaromonas sp. (strain JS666 / ATCC BAA-500) TaxID=296591 RepID=UPI0000463CB3|nr:AraC family transcriptional regulator [Polaromonas sp. JS666]ABE42013.1 transcriptional regulator, AraC family [Polaromonas sp. JS666]